MRRIGRLEPRLSPDKSALLDALDPHISLIRPVPRRSAAYCRAECEWRSRVQVSGERGLFADEIASEAEVRASEQVLATMFPESRGKTHDD